MSARDDILAGKWQQDPDPKAQLAALVGLLARNDHERAEEIRKEAREYGEHTEMAMRIAANLIDPFTSPDGDTTDYSYRCPNCSWNTRDSRYENHVCPNSDREEWKP